MCLTKWLLSINIDKLVYAYLIKELFDYKMGLKKGIWKCRRIFSLGLGGVLGRPLLHCLHFLILGTGSITSYFQ